MSWDILGEHGSNPTVVAAVVSGIVAVFVSAISTLASFTIARRQLTAEAENKSKDLNVQTKLKIEEINSQADLKKLEISLESEIMRQAQMLEVVKKRIETYPKLYEIISVYGRNWEIEGKPRDLIWASSFLKALIEHNAVSGAFFSDVIYRWYGALRSRLETLVSELQERNVTEDEMAEIYDVIRGPKVKFCDEEVQAPGLGSLIKDELGSFITAVVSARHSNYPEEWRDLLADPESLLERRSFN